MTRRCNDDDLLQDGQNEETAMSAGLEKRVATALTLESVASADLAALLEEVEVAIAATKLEQKKLLIPLRRPMPSTRGKQRSMPPFCATGC